ncbi:MAG TPA: hypothetical protein VD905_11060 [Flavobacteriales bacterium]|nr:hypothetical protein [Flavobacteriales bacterium]
MTDIKLTITLVKKRLFQCKRFFSLVVVLCMLFTKTTAQTDYTESFKAKRTFYFTWDSKITFISNEYAQVKSVKLGFDFGGKTKFGLGYNWYKGDIVRTLGGSGNPLHGNLKFRYLSIFTEYVYFLNDKWEATIPAQAGMGFMQYNKEFTKEKIPGAGGFFLTYEPASTLVFRFLKYFGAGLGIGYRLVILTGKNLLKENFQSPVLMIRTKIYFDKVMHDVRKLFLK